jgi:hypothetical protein
VKQVVPRLRNEQVSFKWQVAQPARVPVTGWSAMPKMAVVLLRGVVQLSGFARSAAERVRAEALARATPGVAGVRNDIVVQP